MRSESSEVRCVPSAIKGAVMLSAAKHLSVDGWPRIPREVPAELQLRRTRTHRRGMLHRPVPPPSGPTVHAATPYERPPQLCDDQHAMNAPVPSRTNTPPCTAMAHRHCSQRRLIVRDTHTIKSIKTPNLTAALKLRCPFESKLSGSTA